MPSDLQRVARGLVDCLDEVPSVVAHLRRTADRCRENAAVAIAASHGRATVAAQQLDAAARACEAAAHYLSMAPPKARAWTERLVGDTRTTNRPDTSSADRNKATGGTGDVAERGSEGRTKRLTATFDDVELAENNEPPLIAVARKALEKFRKQAEEDRGLPEDPVELEIFIAETGEIVVPEEDEREREDQDFGIAVDLTEAVQQLLATMAESNNQTWERANLTITPGRVEAAFDYPEDRRSPPVVVDINLPDLPEPNPFDFDPAVDPRPLGSDFAPGVHDGQGSFLPKERRIANRLAEEGWRIDARPEDHGSGNPNPDTMVRKDGDGEGVIVEFKTQDSGSSNAVKRNMLKASRQLSTTGEVVIDGRPVGLTEETALRSFRRACGQPGSTVVAVVHVILGDGRLVTFTKEL
jgi:hypothetical protein